MREKTFQCQQNQTRKNCYICLSKKIQNSVLFSEYSKYNELMMNTRLEQHILLVLSEFMQNT